MPLQSPRSLTWLAAILGLSLLVLFLLFVGTRARYETRLQRQLWPGAPPKLDVISNSPATSEKTVLLLGDSRMAFWSLPKLTNWHIINAGTPGLTTGQVRLRAPELLDQFHPDTVVFEGGINDLKFLGLKPAREAELVSLVVSNITAIVQECGQRRARIIVLTIWPAGQPGAARQLVWSSAVATGVLDVNRQLRTLNSPEAGVEVVDLFKETGLKPEPGLYRDTLHLEASTYELLTPALQRILDKTQP